MHCMKLLGQRLMARDFDRQVAELQIRIAVLNGYTALGIPVTEPVDGPSWEKGNLGIQNRFVQQSRESPQLDFQIGVCESRPNTKGPKGSRCRAALVELVGFYQVLLYEFCTSTFLAYRFKFP